MIGSSMLAEARPERSEARSPPSAPLGPTDSDIRKRFGVTGDHQDALWPPGQRGCGGLRP